MSRTVRELEKTAVNMLPVRLPYGFNHWVNGEFLWENGGCGQEPGSCTSIAGLRES